MLSIPVTPPLTILILLLAIPALGQPALPPAIAPMKKAALQSPKGASQSATAYLVIRVPHYFTNIVSITVTEQMATNGLQLACGPIVDPSTVGINMFYGLTNSTATNVVDEGLTNYFVVSGLIVGQTYWFYLTAYNAAGSSPPSNLVVVPVPSLTNSYTAIQFTNWNSVASSGSTALAPQMFYRAAVFTNALQVRYTPDFKAWLTNTVPGQFKTNVPVLTANRQ